MTQPTGYSYVRFSTTEQRKGHSLERQTERAREWCERKGVVLDTSRTWHDLGRRAFLGDHRNNPDRRALAAFLRLVEQDKIPRGSYLVIESLDRLTREHVRAGLMLCLGLIEKGIRIVQLSPSEIVYDETADNMSLMMMICELARGHGESKRKSDLSGPAWRKKKQGAREGRIVTDRLPAWVEVRRGSLCLIPDRAAAVRRVFELTIAGYGIPRIVAKLTSEEVPAIGKTGKWVKGYVGRILRDRRAMGEYQPRAGKKRLPDGEPVPNYFPAVVTEQEFNAARAASTQRNVNPALMAAGAARARLPRKRKDPGEAGAPVRTAGSPAGKVNLFAGLIRNAREGDSYFMTMRTQRTGPPRYHVLINSNSEQGRSPCFAFQYDAFERAVLACLSEIDPREITGEDNSAGEIMSLSGELEGVEADLRALSEELDRKVTPTLMAAAQRKDDRKRELVGLLQEAKQRAASPLAASWGEYKSLAAALDAADPDDARLRLRSALRRCVGSMWLLVVPRGRDRLAAVQVYFSGGDSPRGYLIFYRSPRSNATGQASPGGWWARCLDPDDPDAGAIDLRQRTHAEALAARLEALDLAEAFPDVGAS